MKAFLPVLLLILSLSASGQPVQIDTTFGVSGKVRTDINGLRNTMNATLIQPDGKIVAIGCSEMNPTDENSTFMLARYNTDGSLDNGFGSKGKVMTSIYNNDVAMAGALQKDGKIIVAGYAFSEMTFELVLTRYNTDGTLDLSFGSGGIVVTDIEGSYDFAENVFVQPDGKILVAGWTTHRIFSNGQPVFARYNADGSLDSTYGSGGVVKLDLDQYGWHAILQAATLQPDGKLAAVGYIRVNNPVPGGIRERLFAVRLNTDGTLDQSFGDLGITATEITPFIQPNSLALNSEGKLIVLCFGQQEQFGEGTVYVAKFTDTGSVDSTFGVDGVAGLPFNNNHKEGYSLVLENDQKILISGLTLSDNSGLPETFIARLNDDGTLDDTFGMSGKITTPFFIGVVESNGITLALQSDGKIVLGGSINEVGSLVTDFGLMRFMVDASLPVMLVSFLARQEKNQVALGWKTSAEVNSDVFEVEHSMDGKQWAVIGMVKSHNNSHREINYSFTHADPNAGQNYYRLKMTDLDGSFAYSAIVAVKIDTQTLADLSVYPNPTDGKVKFRQKDISQIQVFNGHGAEQGKIKWKGQELDLSPLRSGIYHIVVQDQHGRKENFKVLLAK